MAMVSLSPRHHYLLYPPGGALTCPGHQPPAPGEGTAGGGPRGWEGAPCPQRVPSALLWSDGWGVPGNRGGDMGTSLSECPPSTGLGRCDAPWRQGRHALPPIQDGFVGGSGCSARVGHGQTGTPTPGVSPTLGTLVAAEAARGLAGGRGVGAGPRDSTVGRSARTGLSFTTKVWRRGLRGVPGGVAAGPGGSPGAGGGR